MNRTLVTAPVLTPVSVAEAKSHLVVDHTDDDTYIGTLIDQAVDFCERFTGKKIMSQVWRYGIDCMDSFTLVFPAYNVTAVNNLVITDSNGTQTTTAAENDIDDDYYLNKSGAPFAMEPINDWPDIRDEGFNNLTIELTQGYTDASDVPDGIKTAILLIVGHLYRNRESVTAIAMSELPLGVKDFLYKHKAYSL